MAKENHRGKKYVAAAAGLNRDELHDLTAAVTKVKSMAKAKFDETVDLAVRLGLDTKKSEQTIRGTVSMPSGTGKSVRVAVFAQGDNAKAAREAGADIVGAEDLAADIEKGNMNFDIAIATPDLMPLVGKLGRALGPRGLMPNPKTGTVTPDVAGAVQEVKKGKIAFRVDKFGIVHSSVGRVSFTPEQLAENAHELVATLVKMKPSSAKGIYMKTISVASTMSPGIAVDPKSFKV